MITTIRNGGATVDIDWNGAQSLPADRRCPHLRNLIVHPDLRRKGYGTLVVQKAMRKINGPVTAGVLLDNEAALQLFFKLGFKVTGYKHWDEKRKSDVYMLIHRQDPESENKWIKREDGSAVSWTLDQTRDLTF